MAIRKNVLICVYKLGGVVHEVETSKITTTTNVKSSDFDRVIFHRYSCRSLESEHFDFLPKSFYGESFLSDQGKFIDYLSASTLLAEFTKMLKLTSHRSSPHRSPSASLLNATFQTR